MTYICQECGYVFAHEEAAKRIEKHDEIPGGFYEVFLACPDCGSDDFEEADYCYECGKPVESGKLISSYYCPECLEEFAHSPYAAQFARENLNEFAEYVYEKENCKCSSARDT